MKPPTKMLINCENRMGLQGLDARDENGHSIELEWSGKQFDIVQPTGAESKIYRMIEAHSGVIFLTDEPKGLSFYPVPMIVFFATDREGNYFGKISGMGGLSEEKAPIGYVTKAGKFGKIAEDFNAFLELVVFHPRWRECLSGNLSEKSLSELCKEIAAEGHPEFPVAFQEIIDRLGLKRKPEALDTLFTYLSGEAGFVVYESMEEAKRDYTFLEFNFDF